MADGDVFTFHQVAAATVVGPRHLTEKASSPGHNNPRRQRETSLTSTMDLLPGKMADGRHIRSLPWTVGCRAWCCKYFWEDRTLSASQDPHEQDEDCGRRLVASHRRIIGIAVPVVIVHLIWWSLMIRYNLWYLFPDRYILTLTMIFASVIAGMTSIGGGAIAFPVLTLILNVSPDIARDFALLIQSFGMTCATFTIFFLKVRVDWWAIVCGTIGGAVGLIVGLIYIEQHLTPSWKKMIFSSFWFSFAFALFLLNRYRKRKTFLTIPCFTWWKGMVLLLTGIVGGVFTSFVGAGLDICSLSVLTLFFRVSEKTATPTSVVLMAFNSVLGAFWRGAIMLAVSEDTWSYLVVASVAAVVSAPMGSVLSTRLHRQVLATIIYVIVTITLISSFLLVPQTPVLASTSAGIIMGGSLMFFGLTFLGEKLKATVCEGDEEEMDKGGRGSSSSDGSSSTYSGETITGSSIIKAPIAVDENVIVSHL